MALFGSSTIEGVEAVACQEASLAMVNPAAVLTFAYRGLPPFARPLPVRLIGVIPSYDQILFAVRADTGLRAFEEIGTRRYPLRIAMRGQPNHCLHLMFAQIALAAGFSVEDLRSWGGAICKKGGVPRPDSVQFQALDRGEVDAIFDEGVSFWLEEALRRGMTILSLSNATLGRLEQAGFRRARIDQAHSSPLAGRRPYGGFQRLADFCARSLAGRTGDANLRRARSSQGADSLGGGRTAAGRAHVPRCAGYADRCAVTSGSRMLLAAASLPPVSTAFGFVRGGE